VGRRRGLVGRLAAGLALAALLGASCSRRQAFDTLRVAIHSDPISLDPHLQNEILTHAVLGNVYETATAFDLDAHVHPGLATWENPDDLTCRLHIRPGARFSDGRPVEAADLAFSLERARSHPRSHMRSYLVEVRSITALDAHTVEIGTVRPLPVLLNRLAFVYVVPRDAQADVREPVGSGPYRVAAYERGRRLRLEPRADDPRAAGALPVEFVIVPEAGRRTELLLAGQVQMVFDLAPGDVARVEQAACCRVATRGSTVVNYLALSSTDTRFQDARVRQAIDLALDRRLIAERSYGGRAQPASQMAAPGVFGHDPQIAVPERDLERARALLAEAGFPRGFPVTLEHREGRDHSEIVRQLTELGLQVGVRSWPWAELYPRLQEHSIQSYYGGVGATTGDASDVLQTFLHSLDAARGYGATNSSGFADAAVDTLIEQAGSTADLRDRRRLLQQALRLARDDRYLLPLVVADDLYGLRRDLKWAPRLDRRLLAVEVRPGR
jgi:peptide/nickel transport system substrate-binding protein